MKLTPENQDYEDCRAGGTETGIELPEDVLKAMQEAKAKGPRSAKPKPLAEAADPAS